MAEPGNPPTPLSVFEQLRSWILGGRLPPGQRLPVREIARGLGLSTMPVREALVRLEETGLITQQPRKGAIVSTLSLHDLSDFYMLRQLLEPPSARLGVERMTPERLTRLRSTMANLEAVATERDLVKVLDLDEELLALTFGAVANRQLSQVIQATWARIRPYKLLFTMTQTDAGHYIAREDAQLLAATEEGDSDAAFDLLRGSLDRAHLRLADLLRSHQAGDLGTPPGSMPDDEATLADFIARLAGRTN